MSVRELVERFLAVPVGGDLAALADFYAPDAVIEMPFAPPGVPKRDQGRENFRARWAAFGERRPWTVTKADRVAVHETTDPDVVVVEYDLHATIKQTGAPLVMSYVMVMTVKDGLITHSRDYSNPLPVMEALKDLIAATRSESGESGETGETGETA